MVKNQIKLSKIFGIEITLDFSWFLILLLVTFSISQTLGFLLPGRSPILYLTYGLIGALLLFTSIIIHELGHSLVGRANGIETNKITLFLFGGVSQIPKEPTNAVAEIKMASVGPLISLILGGIFILIATIFGTRIPNLLLIVLTAVGLINIGIAIFNLIPAYPLDGGRILRSIIWLRNRDMLKATALAVIISKIIAVLIILYGLFQVLFGGFFGGLWILFIAFFLFQSSDRAFVQVKIHQLLKGYTARDLIIGTLTYIPANLLPEEFFEVVKEKGQKIYVLNENNVPVGLISLDLLRAQKVKDGEIIKTFMIPIEEIPAISHDDPAENIIPMFENSPAVRIVQDKEILGIVTLSDLEFFLRNII